MDNLIVNLVAVIVSLMIPVTAPHIELGREQETVDKVELTSYEAVEELPLAEPVNVPKAVETPQNVQIQPVGSEYEAKMFIYNHESGNRPEARNAGGCRGLGQACPGSKLPCSDSDYACQDAWFTNYMQNRYGTWLNAKYFWEVESCNTQYGCNWW